MGREPLVRGRIEGVVKFQKGPLAQKERKHEG
jgi:hypothetical protein